MRSGRSRSIRSTRLNDQGEPELKAETINKAADSFFYYDRRRHLSRPPRIHLAHGAAKTSIPIGMTGRGRRGNLPPFPFGRGGLSLARNGQSHTQPGRGADRAGGAQEGRPGSAMPALIIGANLPDVDAACFFWLDGVEHLGFRRGITHGPPTMLLLPLVLAGLLYGFDRWQATRGKRPEARLPVRFQVALRARASRLPDASRARLAQCLRHPPARAVFLALVLRRHAVHHRYLAVAA